MYNSVIYFRNRYNMHYLGFDDRNNFRFLFHTQQSNKKEKKRKEREQSEEKERAKESKRTREQENKRATEREAK